MQGGDLSNFSGKEKRLQRPFTGRKQLLILNCHTAPNGYRLIQRLMPFLRSEQ
jgi:hypothetical protein